MSARRKLQEGGITLASLNGHLRYIVGVRDLAEMTDEGLLKFRQHAIDNLEWAEAYDLADAELENIRMEGDTPISLEEKSRLEELLEILQRFPEDETIVEAARLITHVIEKCDDLPKKGPMSKAAGMVYLIQKEPGVYKIGVTKNLAQRKAQLEKQVGARLALSDSFWSPQAFVDEKWLLNRYEGSAIGGEWVFLSGEEIEDVARNFGRFREKYANGGTR